MPACPRCGHTTHQHKHGTTEAGSQRYRCQGCGARYTPQPKPQAYSAEVRAQALRWYLDGCSLRWIARHLGVVHQSVANWVAAYEAALPAQPPLPTQPIETVELDELWTFVAAKKTPST